jgi:hypothetical protein
MNPLPGALTRRGMIGGAAAVLGCGVGGRSATAADLVLRRGINTWPWFSLTMEYPAPRTDYAWPPFQPARAVPRLVDLVRLRQAGFDFIRLPVDPGPFLSFAGTQRTMLLHSLYDAVAEALSAGLAVIVNLQSNDATHYWVSRRMIGSRSAERFGAYRQLVTDVARGLAGLRSAKVALEPVNEPPQSCRSSEWTDVQLDLQSAARAAANDLLLVATGSCGSMIQGLEQLDPRPIQALLPVVYTFQYYVPYLFSHQGAPWMTEPIYRSLNAVPWPASAGSLEATLAAVRRRMNEDKATSLEAKRSAYRETVRVLTEYFAAQPDRPFVEQGFRRVSAWAQRYGIPAGQILLGEFGALRSDARYVAAGAADRARYVRDVRRTAEASGFAWAFWNLFDGMGIMDDVTRAFDPSIVDALGLTLPSD